MSVPLTTSPVAERKTVFNINIIFVAVFQLNGCKSLLQKSKVCMYTDNPGPWFPFFCLFFYF